MSQASRWIGNDNDELSPLRSKEVAVYVSPPMSLKPSRVPGTSDERLTAIEFNRRPCGLLACCQDVFPLPPARAHFTESRAVEAQATAGFPRIPAGTYPWKPQAARRRRGWQRRLSACSALAVPVSVEAASAPGVGHSSFGGSRFCSGRPPFELQWEPLPLLAATA